MTPQAARFPEKAEKLLAEAGTMLKVGLSDAAGRTADLAAYHAAQVFLFERLQKVLKTHSGVQSEFLRLTKDDPRVDPALRSFLSRAYNLKTIADYETGPGSEIALERAAQAVEEGKRFVANVAAVVSVPASRPESGTQR
ncbi:MAG TPA: HEPN domain-containing protein [Acetobacteraceae bacterium]|nr:HEPN domain-containing protein [Acetobacteraceae bacterium]